MKIKYILSFTLAFALCQKVLSQNFISVIDYGGNGNGSFKNTEAFRKAIDAASGLGGGTVYVPAGDYLTGPIHLKSNITLHIDAGATVRFSDDFDDYLPMVPTRFQGVDYLGFSPLIYGYEVNNVSIVGEGTLDGQGDAWQVAIKELRTKHRAGINVPPNKWQKIFVENNPEFNRPDHYGFQRPLFIQFFNSSRIKIRDVAIKNAPFWTVHFVGCNDVLVDGVYIKNPEESSNTDGINPESSENVKIINSTIDVGDDCIAIKSGKGKVARENYRPTKNIQILNCTMLHGAAGVAIGSEMSAGVEDVLVENCIMKNTSKGIHIKTNRERGGYVKNVRVNNILISDITSSHDKVPAGILLNTVYYLRDSTSYKPISESTPTLEGIHFSNINMKNVKYPIYLHGLEERKIANVSFNNFDIKSTKPIRLKNVEDVLLNDIKISTEENTVLNIENASNFLIKNLVKSAPSDKHVQLSNVANAQFDVGMFTPHSFKIRGVETKDITIVANSQKKIKFNYQNGATKNQVSIKN